MSLSPSFRWIPATSAPAGKITAPGPQWGQGSYPWWWHHHHHAGESEEGGSWGNQEGGGDGHCHGRGWGSVTAVPVPLLCLQQHLLHHGGSQPGLDTTQSWFLSLFLNFLSAGVPVHHVILFIFFLTNKCAPANYPANHYIPWYLPPDALPIPVLPSFLPGHLPHGVVWES